MDVDENAAADEAIRRREAATNRTIVERMTTKTADCLATIDLAVVRQLATYAFYAMVIVMTLHGTAIERWHPVDPPKSKKSVEVK